jgi:hypothetical protein
MGAAFKNPKLVNYFLAAQAKQSQQSNSATPPAGQAATAPGVASPLAMRADHTGVYSAMLRRHGTPEAIHAAYTSAYQGTKTLTGT